MSEKYGIDPGKLVLRVQTNELGVATAEYAFVTEDVGPCSGYALINRAMKAAGLFHAPPYPDFDEHADELTDFEGGMCLPIHSGKSREKTSFESNLARRLDIAVLPAIALLADNAIDILFAPKQNTVVVVGTTTHQRNQRRFP